MTTQKKGLPRGVWEFLVLLLIAAVGYGLWWWLGIEHQADLQAQKDQLVSEHQAELKEARDRVAAALSSEATAAAVAFAAGIETLAAEQRWPAVDRAVLSLLELQGVSFVHVLAPDGAVRVSSDRKVLATGQAGPRADWALGAQGVIQRAAQPRTLEVAVPITADDQPVAVLWLGYRTPAP